MPNAEEFLRRSSFVNKMINPDGSITTMSGEQLLPPDQIRSEQYARMQPFPNKVLMPDGSVSIFMLNDPNMIEEIENNISALTTKVETAQTAASEADTKAVAAQETANQADIKADALELRVGEAETVASEADTKAVAAQTAASEADAKAVAAQTAASEADAKAVAAQTAASEADTKAETADSIATEANNKVDALIIVVNELSTGGGEVTAQEFQELSESVESLSDKVDVIERDLVTAIGYKMSSIAHFCRVVFMKDGSDLTDENVYVKDGQSIQFRIIPLSNCELDSITVSSDYYQQEELIYSIDNIKSAVKITAICKIKQNFSLSILEENGSLTVEYESGGPVDTSNPLPFGSRIIITENEPSTIGYAKSGCVLINGNPVKSGSVYTVCFDTIVSESYSLLLSLNYPSGFSDSVFTLNNDPGNVINTKECDVDFVTVSKISYLSSNIIMDIVETEGPLKLLIPRINEDSGMVYIYEAKINTLFDGISPEYEGFIHINLEQSKIHIYDPSSLLPNFSIEYFKNYSLDLSELTYSEITTVYKYNNEIVDPLLAPNLDSRYDYVNLNTDFGKFGILNYTYYFAVIDVNGEKLVECAYSDGSSLRFLRTFLRDMIPTHPGSYLPLYIASFLLSNKDINNVEGSFLTLERLNMRGHLPAAEEVQEMYLESLMAIDDGSTLPLMPYDFVLLTKADIIAESEMSTTDPDTNAIHFKNISYTDENRTSVSAFDFGLQKILFRAGVCTDFEIGKYYIVKLNINNGDVILNVGAACESMDAGTKALMFEFGMVDSFENEFACIGYLCIGSIALLDNSVEASITINGGVSFVCMGTFVFKEGVSSESIEIPITDVKLVSIDQYNQ